MSRADTYDSRRYDCCAPYHGEIGEEFTRRFKPEFEGALHSFVDNYASLYEHVVLQNDPGSAADPAPGGAAGGAIRATFALRQKKSFGLIRKHIEDPTIRDAMDADAMGDGPAAWTLINQMCSRPQTYLNLADQDKEWGSLSLSDVGISERTVENFKALLDRVNRERPDPQRKSNIQVWQRLLEAISSVGNNELKTMVRNELQVPTMQHVPGHRLAGEPDIPRYVQHFAERWRVLIHDGTIKQSAPRKRIPPAGNRVDAMLTRVTEETATSSAFAVLPSPADGQPEKMCWNCRGFGHVKVDANGKLICPSPVKTRSITTAISLLEMYRRKEAGRGGKRKVFARRGAPSARASVATAQDDLVEVLVDNDGSVYTTEGVYMGNVVDMAGQLTSESQMPPLSETDNAASTPVNAASALGSNEDGEIALMHVDAQTSIDHELHDVDQSFRAGFIPQACMSLTPAGVNEGEEMEVNQEVPMTKRTRLRRPALLIAGSVALALTTVTNRGVGRMLMILGMASIAAASTPRVAVVSVHASLLSANTDPNAKVLNSRTGAAIDTGASMHVSGRKELFPTNLVVDHNPLIKVQIANDVKCAVEFKGTMRIPVKYRSGIATSGTKDGCLMLSNSLYVPDLRENTLISPRAMFHDHGMRTYFNDDRFVRTTEGMLIDFVETSTLYVLPFSKNDKAGCKALAVEAHTSADDIHSRCMHFSLDKIRRSLDSLENAQAIGEHMSHTNCASCGTANARRQNAHPQKTPKFHKAGDCVCSDTCDMGEYSTPFGFRYFLTFMDMATRYLWVYFLRTHMHAEVRAAYTQFLADATPYFDQGKVKLWFTDNGTEFNVSAGVGKDKPGFFANDTDTWLSEYFTRRRFIVPWHPNQNPAESVNRILLGPARAAIHAAGVHTRFWPFAIHQAAIVHNVLVTLSLAAMHAYTSTASAASLLIDVIDYVKNQIARPQSPYMMLRKRKFDFSLLHTLFCMCDVLIRNPGDLQNRPKAASRMTKAIHLGLDHRRAGFFVYLIEFQRFTTSAIRDTVFKSEKIFPDVGPFLGGEIRQGQDASRLRSAGQQELERPAGEFADRQPLELTDDRGETHGDEGPPSARTRSRLTERDARICRTDQSPHGFTVIESDCGFCLALKSDVWRPIQCPSSPREAIEQDREGWIQAYTKDFQAKMENGAFEYVQATEGMIVHKCTWAHKLIWNDDNTLAERRARLVGCGYSQVQGRDYASSYSGTPKATAVRLFLAALAVYDLEDEHCDVIKAFTQNDVTA